MIQISQSFCFINVNKAVLKFIRNYKEGGSSHYRKEKEGYNKFPLETDVIEPV